jgi:NAD(P)-dependent dehydrogenase (short-subunit alcohol dehydrogenase family)
MTMVSLSEVHQTNASAVSKLPAGLVAVFAGATAGIGETALKAFAKHTLRPKIYFIGRSQEAGDRLQIELKELNPEGSYIFIKKDMSLLKNVDEVCRDIKSKEPVLNVLFLSQGTLRIGVGKLSILSVGSCLYSPLKILMKDFLRSWPSRTIPVPVSQSISSHFSKRHLLYEE